MCSVMILHVHGPDHSHDRCMTLDLIAQVACRKTSISCVTNRIPRRLATQFMGWFSKIEQPLVRDLSIARLAAVRRS